MSRVTFTAEAAAELRERVARYDGLRQGVMIFGPMGPNARQAESEEEAEQLDIAYGPAQRWVVRVLSLGEIDHIRAQASKSSHLFQIDEMPAVVVSHVPEVNLHIELSGETIRITELGR